MQFVTINEYMESGEFDRTGDTIVITGLFPSQNHLLKIYYDNLPSSTIKQIKELDVEIFPNPIVNELNIRGNFEIVILYDMLGKELKTFDYTQKINFLDIPNGNYLLKFVGKDEQYITKKIIKIE